jgi:hypothetical protein
MVGRVKVWKVLELLLERQDFLLRRVVMFNVRYFGDICLRLRPPLVAVSET